jgi:predicted PurR-regulated permease PerM
MELFLPSLFVILLAVLVILYVIPRQSGFVLGIIAAGLLAMTIYQHVSLFKMDYQRMTWVDTIKQQAPLIMVVAVIVVLIGYVLLLTGKGPAANIQNRVEEVYNPPSSPGPNANRNRNRAPNNNEGSNLERRLERES